MAVFLCMSKISVENYISSGSNTKPELVLGLVLDCGPIWGMKWCPTGTWEAAEDCGGNLEVCIILLVLSCIIIFMLVLYMISFIEHTQR